MRLVWYKVKDDVPKLRPYLNKLKKMSPNVEKLEKDVKKLEIMLMSYYQPEYC